MKIQTTRIFSELDRAVSQGYTTVSLQGSSRSSKTYNTLIWLTFYCLRNPGTRVSVVRATLPAIKGSVFVDFKEILHTMELYDEKALNKSELTYTFPNGSWFEFFSTDSEQKLRGRKRDVLFVNEANELRQIEWQQLKMRTTRFAIIDYNPSFSDDHWICEVNKDERTYHFISTYKDNPFLEQAIVDEIESLKTKNESLWRIYGLGIQAIVEGLVYRNWDIVDTIPDYVKKRFGATDWGFTNDPTAILEVAINGEDIYIDEVCYRTNMLTSDIIEVLKSPQMKGLKIISESADPRLVQEIYRAGINIHPVTKYKGSIEAGISKLQEFKLHVTKRSTNVQKELKNYTYAQDKEGKWLNQPIDAFNHCFTADTLVETTHGQVRIDQIQEGDMVQTSNGPRKVTKTFQNGRKQIIHVNMELETGVVELKATPDHLIKTTEGWKELQQLRTGDVLYAPSNSTETPGSPTARKAALLSIRVLNESEANVFDIEVDEMHEFFANGILVHNCLDALRYVCMEQIMGGARRPIDLERVSRLIY